MMIENKLLDGPKAAKPIKRRAVFRWQVFCGARWCGDVVMFEAPPFVDPLDHDFAYDGITAGGDKIGPFEKRGDAAVAIAQAVQP
jgi:hypothetical protein